MIQGIVEDYHQALVNVHEIYGGKVTLPEGWEYVAFRVPKKGEHFLTPEAQAVAGPCHQDVIGYEIPKGPRIIVRRKF